MIIEFWFTFEWNLFWRDRKVVSPDLDDGLAWNSRQANNDQVLDIALLGLSQWKELWLKLIFVVLLMMNKKFDANLAWDR